MDHILSWYNRMHNDNNYITTECIFITNTTTIIQRANYKKWDIAGIIKSSANLSNNYALKNEC